MSIKPEKIRSLEYAREFLRSLLDPKSTPRVPTVIRKRASQILRHYPSPYDILIKDDDGKFRKP